ncbi:unnamed protein product, partial [Mesorhabditis belari]|uniref:Uncharacterized protein n=1 Tax=Mesorhabditis belari TaxID=2138241 RepID=A0AAF3F2C9_9BILA
MNFWSSLLVFFSIFLSSFTFGYRLDYVMVPRGFLSNQQQQALGELGNSAERLEKRFDLDRMRRAPYEPFMLMENIQKPRFGRK